MSVLEELPAVTGRGCAASRGGTGKQIPTAEGCGVVTPTARKVVLVPFPFSDLSQSKVRPTVAASNTPKEMLVKKRLVLGSLLLLLCSSSGCSSNSADSLMTEEIKNLNELAEALETKAPEAKVNELQSKLRDTNKKIEALKLSEDEKKKLVERHRDEMAKASMRFAKASMNKAFGQGFPGMQDPSKMPVIPGAGGVPAGYPGAAKE